jgi:hypothetical protein
VMRADDAASTNAPTIERLGRMAALPLDGIINPVLRARDEN